MRSVCKHLHEVNLISLLLHSLMVLITVLQLQVCETCHPGWRAILCCWLPAVAEWSGWGTRGRRIHVCKTCHRYLRGKKLPHAAMCNDMDFGNLAPGMLHIILRLSLFTFPVIIYTHYLLLLISLQKWNARPTSWRTPQPANEEGDDSGDHFEEQYIHQPERKEDHQLLAALPNNVGIFNMF